MDEGSNLQHTNQDEGGQTYFTMCWQFQGPDCWHRKDQKKYVCRDRDTSLDIAESQTLFSASCRDDSAEIVKLAKPCGWSA